MGFFLWVCVMLFLARFFLLMLCWVGLSACQTSQGSDGYLADPATRVFNFDWRLSGDPQVGPMQVFDNGARVWLHFAPGQGLPAVFGLRDGQETLLSLKALGQFQVVEGLWSELVFRAGRAQARASLKRPQSTGGFAPGEQASEALPPSSSFEDASQQGAVSLPQSQSTVELKKSGGQVSVALTQSNSSSLDPEVLGSAKASPEEKPEAVFELRLKDKTLRQTLMRWARQAKWVFAPEHWVLEVDFPIKSDARFEGGFETAVAQLLAAAELNAYRLQACFYSNQVLRVLPWPQDCDPGVREELPS